MPQERLQKIIARAGIASRRAAEELITSGRVRVNGRTVKELGTRVDARHDRVEVDGRRLVAEPFVYLVFHKPRGIVSTVRDPEGRPTVRELVKVPERIFPVGRLDFHTSGVLLLTNDGAFCDGLLHPKRSVPKTYVVKVGRQMTDQDLEQWARGVELEDGVTRPAEVRLLRHEQGKTWFEITIGEGRNQQIRRMGEATGFPVMRLARVAFATIDAEGLRPGQWRPLSRDELVELRSEYGVPARLPTGPAPQRPAFAATRGRGPDARPAREQRAPKAPATKRPVGPSRRSDGRGLTPRTTVRTRKSGG